MGDIVAMGESLGIDDRLGNVTDGAWETVEKLSIQLATGSPHRSKIVDSSVDAIRLLVDCRWYSLTHDDLVDAWESENATNG